MAGSGARFSVAGYRAPKPLIDLFGKTMIETVIDNLRPPQPACFILVCQREHYQQYKLERVFRRNLGRAWDCMLLNGLTEGAACTVLAAHGLIDDEAELIVANSDQIVDCGIGEFIDCAREGGAEGMVMTFPASDPKWSYVRTDAQGHAVEVAEKRVISPHATVGIYYFSSGRVFKDAARAMIAQNIRVNDEFYVAPVYNEIIRHGGKVRIWEIDASAMHGIGTPADLESYFALKGGYVSRSAPVR